mmetsp:Transcript_28067/g.45531  ORF Transcript_28067/g.45531 Transcript_28067/m.45531 type:complete len:227 (+) Transcript_28067:546-1226(+)
MVMPEVKAPNILEKVEADLIGNRIPSSSTSFPSLRSLVWLCITIGCFLTIVTADRTGAPLFDVTWEEVSMSVIVMVPTDMVLSSKLSNRVSCSLLTELQLHFTLAPLAVFRLAKYLSKQEPIDTLKAPTRLNMTATLLSVACTSVLPFNNLSGSSMSRASKSTSAMSGISKSISWPVTRLAIFRAKLITFITVSYFFKKACCFFMIFIAYKAVLKFFACISNGSSE